MRSSLCPVLEHARQGEVLQNYQDRLVQQDDVSSVKHPQKVERPLARRAKSARTRSRPLGEPTRDFVNPLLEGSFHSDSHADLAHSGFGYFGWHSVLCRPVY